MNDSSPVLILDGQTNQALACTRSLGEKGFPVLVASHWRRPLAGWSRYCRGVFHLAAEEVGAFAALRGWAQELGVRTVLPLTERACCLCKLEREAWEAAGIRVGCGTQEMLLNAFDKARTVRLASSCGVAVPATVCPASLEEAVKAAEQVGYPCVVKPRCSHLWNGTHFLPNRSCAYVNEPQELKGAVEARRQGDCWPLVQQYVPGHGKGVFALCDRGTVVAWFAHERLREIRPSGAGSSLRRSIALEPRLRQPAERLLGQLQWHGPAMVEFREEGASTPWLMEVNGRFWTSLQLAVEAGVDFPAIWLSVLNGERVAPVADYTPGVTLRWLWGDVKRLMFILAGRPRGYTGPFPSLPQGFRDLFGAQPPGTHLEIWRRTDPWPAIGEWHHGVQELLMQGRHA